MKNSKIVSYFFLCYVLTPPPSHANSNNVVIYIHDVAETQSGELHPRPSGGTRALNIAILHHLLTETKTEYTIKTVPLIRALQGLRQQQIALAPTITKTKSRERAFNWIGPISSDKLEFYQLKKWSELPANPKRNHYWEKRVCIINGGATEQTLREKGFNNFETVSNYEDCLNMLLAQRVRYAAMPRSNFLAQSKKIGTSDITIANIPSIQMESYIATSLSTPTDILDKFRSKLDELKKSKKYSEMIKFYHSKY